MSKDIARGMVWRRLMGRIADRRAARVKPKKPTSVPTMPPAPDQFNAQTGIGSAGLIASSSYFPSLLTSWQGYSALPIDMEIISDWPPDRDEYLSTVGCPPPIPAGTRPPL